MIPQTKSPPFVLVALWTFAGVALALLIGLMPAFLGHADRSWISAVTKFSAVTTPPFAVSALLFFTGRRRAGIIVAGVVLAAVSTVAAVVVLGA